LPRATAQIAGARSFVIDAPSGASRLCGFSAHLYCFASISHSDHETPFTGSVSAPWRNACPSLELRNLFALDCRGSPSFRKNERDAAGYLCRRYGIGMALTFDEFGMWRIYAEMATPSGSPFRHHGRSVSHSDFVLPAAFQIARPC